jgi:hypothetical protein
MNFIIKVYDTVKKQWFNRPLETVITGTSTGNGVSLGETSQTAYRGDRGKEAYDHSKSNHADTRSVTLDNVKRDTEISSAISLKHSNSNDHAPGSDNQDLSGLVVKETNKSLVLDTEIAKIHALNADNQDLSGLVVKETGKSLVSDTEITKLSGVAANAQKNSDITKEEIEAKLTGAISSHSHAAVNPFTAKLVLGADKPTGANVTPVTLGLSFDYEANSQYAIDIYAIVAPAVATTGCGFLIDVSSAVTFVGTFTSHQLAIAGTISGGGSAGDLGAASQGVSSGMVLAGSNFVYGGGILVTGANPGTATFYFRSETTAVTTLKAGSIFRVMKMN